MKDFVIQRDVICAGPCRLRKLNQCTPLNSLWGSSHKRGTSNGIPTIFNFLLDICPHSPSYQRLYQTTEMVRYYGFEFQMLRAFPNIFPFSSVVLPWDQSEIQSKNMQCLLVIGSFVPSLHAPNFVNSKEQWKVLVLLKGQNLLLCADSWTLVLVMERSHKGFRTDLERLPRETPIISQGGSWSMRLVPLGCFIHSSF